MVEICGIGWTLPNLRGGMSLASQRELYQHPENPTTAHQSKHRNLDIGMVNLGVTIHPASVRSSRFRFRSPRCALPLSSSLDAFRWSIILLPG